MKTLEELGIKYLPWKVEPYQTVTEEWRVMRDGVLTPLASSLDRRTATLIAAVADLYQATLWCKQQADEIGAASLSGHVDPIALAQSMAGIARRCESALRKASGE